MNNNKAIPIICGVVVILAAAIVCLSVGLSDKIGSSDPSELNAESAYKMLSESAELVDITNYPASKGTVTYDTAGSASELPDIESSYPYVVTPKNKDIVVEIFSSPEKAGNGTDGWLKELAEDYNKSNASVNGKSVGIALRSISSGTQIDYIESGTYIPDAITPSASMWADMLEFSGTDLILINDKMVGNTAGVLIDNATYSSLEASYGTVDIKTIITATENGTITAGYTNPFSSTSGLNFLASTLYSYDESNPLSSAAVDGFNRFQSNVPFVAYNTLQMRTAAENTTFTCFINEYQGYYNNSELKNNYKFLAYGIRHDNPLYAIDGISQDKLDALKAFSDFCSTNSAVELATRYGFNLMENYTSTIPATDGNTWTQMQKVWKKNKNNGKPIAAVFVLDTSGSMSGEPLNALKDSLNNSMKYINSSNYVGVVSYSTNVNVDLPIGLFDINQQAYFQGAVSGLTASGNTATYSALAQAAIMLEDFMAENSNVQPMIFLLSDGKQNEGASLKEITAPIQYFSIPIYTIGYNADLDELKMISSLNEAASIDADNDDVIYQLKNLFNANL